MRFKGLFRNDLRKLILLLAIFSGVAMLANGFYASYRVQRQLLIDNALAANEAYAQKLAIITEDFLRSTQQQLTYSASSLPPLLEQREALAAETSRLGKAPILASRVDEKEEAFLVGELCRFAILFGLGIFACGIGEGHCWYLPVLVSNLPTEIPTQVLACQGAACRLVPQEKTLRALSCQGFVVFVPLSISCLGIKHMLS